jgi:hypothetical protein
MIGKNWLYYILDEMGRSYYVSNGIVQKFKHSCSFKIYTDGWQKILFAWERNWKYYGVNRNVTNPLNYVEDGALIMRYIFLNGNIETKAYLLIQKKATYEIQCNTTANNYVKILDDGIDFADTMNFTIPDFPQDGLYFKFLIPLAFISEEGDSYGLYKTSQEFTEVPFQPEDENNWVKTSTGYFFDSIQATTITVSGTITLKNNDVANTSNWVYYKTSSGAQYNILVNKIIAVGATFSQDYSINITLAPNETFFMIYYGGSYSDGPNIFYPAKVGVVQSNFSISTSTRQPATTFIGRRMIDVFQELVNAFCPGYTVSSTVMNAMSRIVLASGKSIRGFDDAVLKTNFDDFFKAMSILMMAGLEYNDDLKTVEIENISKYFDASDPIYLGEVTNFKWSVLTEQMFNIVNIGYQNQNYDSSAGSVNGLQEFNTTEEFTTVITRISKTLDMVMPYRADSLGAEKLRVYYQDLDTTSTSGDDDIWFFNIEDTPGDDGVYKLRRIKYDSITGVLLDTNGNYSAYNIEDLTPKRLMQTNGALLRSWLYGFDQSSFIFQTTDKNPALSTTLAGTTITEAADQLIGNLAPRLLKPVLFTFDPEPLKGLIDLLNANSNRCFSFTYNGNLWKGFNIKVGIAPNNNEVQSFQLLSTPDNDLTKLING